MLFSRSVFIGINPQGSGRSVSYAALDNRLQVMALGKGDPDAAVAFVGGQQQAVVAIQGPPRLNNRLLRDDSMNLEIPASARSKRKKDMRVVEDELIKRKFKVYKTPSSEADAKPWMSLSIDLYAQLAGLGYKFYPNEKSKLLLMESISEVSFQAWMGNKLFRKGSLEGRLQRQLGLYKLGVEIPDPMLYFEEITRYRIFRGELPESGLYSGSEIQVLALAYTAWAALTRPDEIQLLGDRAEGQVVIPTANLEP